MQKKVFLLIFIVSLFAVTASATTDYVDPNGDSTPLEWSPTPGGTHYTTIDDGTRQPTAPDLNDYLLGTDHVDVFDMSSIDLGGGTATEITIWTYGSDETSINIYANGEWKTPHSNIAVPADWDFSTWTGTFTQTDINNLQVKLTAAGFPDVFAMYAEITYTEEVPEFFGIHFEWFDLSSGLIAVILAIALPSILFRRKK